VFSLVSSLPSTNSAGLGTRPLFAGLFGTMKLCDSPPTSMSDLWPRAFSDRSASMQETDVSGVSRDKVGHLTRLFSELHTPPDCTSVNASSCRLPDTTHHSRPRRLARSYLVRLFHSLPSSGLLPTLLDHPIRSRQHVRRDRDADLLCGLKIDHQLELRLLLHGRHLLRRGTFGRRTRVRLSSATARQPTSVSSAHSFRTRRRTFATAFRALLRGRKSSIPVQGVFPERSGECPKTRDQG
jgi:hypothetical protein